MSNCTPYSNRILSQNQTHIKTYEGTFVAVDGVNMTHKLSYLPETRIPHSQVLTGRVTLRPGQTNYLLNFLGLGDNATFLTIVAAYDERSKFESDNYVQYSYYSEPNTIYSFAQMMVLTGNSENRIEQLYLHNPNKNSEVILEVMVGVIDDYHDFFQDQSGGSSDNNNTTTFNNVKHTDISLWDEDSGVMVLKNSFDQNILYLDLEDINTLEREGKILTVTSTTVGQIMFIFSTEYDASQVRAKITQWIDDYNNETINVPIDDFEPIITFTNFVIDDDTSIPYGSYLTSIDGDRRFLLFNELKLSDYSGTITKQIMSNIIINKVEDFNSNLVIVSPSTDLIIRDNTGDIISGDIMFSGEYYVYFNIKDNNGNTVDPNVNIKINVID